MPFEKWNSKSNNIQLFIKYISEIYDGKNKDFKLKKDIQDKFSNIITEWNDYTKINWAAAALLMRKPAWIFDVRSIVNPEEIIKNGFNLWRIGDGTL